MTRMLFWNVEQFNPARFYSASGAADPLAGMTQQASSVVRQTLLYDVIKAANPDVIVIVEVNISSHRSTRLAQNTGALVELLTWLRTVPAAPPPPPAVHSNEWRLVPPYWLAGAGNAGLESVAVFYRGRTGTVDRYFTGPDVWPGGLRAPALPGGATGAYGINTRAGQNVNFNAMLVPPQVPPVPSRTIPVGAQHNAGLAENVVAARFTLRVNNANVPGANATFGVARPPLMVTMTERTAAGALRDLTVFGIHAPANAAGSVQFITTLAGTFEVAGDLGVNETRVIGGDFNSQLLQPNGTMTAAYTPLTTHAMGYQLLLRPPAAGPPPNLDAYRGYFGTHLQKLSDINMAQLRQSKFLWSASITDRSQYPGYGFLSAQFFSLDNVLVRPFVATQNYQTTIMNTVVASPLNAVSPVPGNAPVGTLAIAAEMPNVPVSSQPWPPAPFAASFTAPNATTLLEWDRYGHIVSTSDHFALFVDV